MRREMGQDSWTRAAEFVDPGCSHQTRRGPREAEPGLGVVGAAGSGLDGRPGAGTD